MAKASKKTTGNTNKKKAPRGAAERKTGGQVFTCSTCGRVTTDKGHLCTPVMARKSFTCESCGLTSSNARHLCKPKVKKLKFCCDTCGRVAEAKEHLCRPKAIR